MKKRVMSLLLMLCMIVSLLPMGIIDARADSISGPIEVVFHPEVVSPTGTTVRVGEYLRLGNSSYKVTKIGQATGSPYDVTIELPQGFNGEITLPDGKDLWTGVPEVSYILGNGADRRKPGEPMPVPAQSLFQIPYYFADNNTIDYPVEKRLNGRAWTDEDAFTFKIEPGNTATSNAIKNGRIEIVEDEITITKSTPGQTRNFYIKSLGLPAGSYWGYYQFTISEVLPAGVTSADPNKDGIQYDTRTYTIKVSHHPNSGALAVYDSDEKAIFTNNYTDPDKKITGLTKTLLTSGQGLENGVTLPEGVTFPDGTGEVTIPENGSVTLAYKIEVTGDAGANFVVNDEGATLIGSNCGATTTPDGKFTGTIPAGGTAILYVTKTFSSTDVVDGKVKNKACVEAGENTQVENGPICDEVETPVKDGGDCDGDGNCGGSCNLGGIQKDIISSAGDVPGDITLPPEVTFPDGDGTVQIPDGGSVTLAYAIKVTGDEGAKFIVTDNGATLIGSNCSAITESSGKFTGTIPAGGTAILYVTKQFTAADLTDSGKLSNTATVTPGDPGTSGGGEDTEEVPGEEEKPDGPSKQITGIEKTVLPNGESLPEGIVLPSGVTFPNADGKVEIPDGGSVTLAYAIRVTGDEGAKFIVTDNGATLIGSNCSAVTESSGKFTGTIPAGGEAILYVTKEYTKEDLTVDGKLSNTATVEPGDSGTSGGGEDTEEVPGEEEKPDGPSKQITGIEKTILPNDESLPEGIVLPSGITFPNADGKVEIPDGGSVTLAYAIRVTGDEGAKFIVTDNGATLIGSNCSAVTESSGKFTGTIPAGGEAILYVTKEYTKEDLTVDGKLFNTATVEPGDPDTGGEGEDQEEVPGEEVPNPIELFKITQSNRDALPSSVQLPDDIRYTNQGNVTVPADYTGTVTLLYELRLPGTPGTSFTITDERAVLVHSNCGATTKSSGVFEGIVPDTGVALLYVTKTHTAEEVATKVVHNDAKVIVRQGTEILGSDTAEANDKIGPDVETNNLSGLIISMLQKKDLPEGVPDNGFTYRPARGGMSIPSQGSVIIPYKLEISGLAGAAFQVQGKFGQILRDDCAATVSGDILTGTIKADGTACVYVTRVVTAADVESGFLRYELVYGDIGLPQEKMKTAIHNQAVTVVAAVSQSAPAQTWQAGAVVKENATYTWADTGEAAPSSISPTLVFDNLNAEELEHESALQSKVDATLGNDGNNRQYDFRYIDIVDEATGDSLEADSGVDIYWPYPEGTDQNTDFSVLHFEGIKRGDDLASELAQVTPVVLSGEADGLTKTDTHIKFHTDTFSPFVLIWDKQEESGNVGGGGSGGGSTAQYTLTYESNGGTKYDQEKYDRDQVVKIDKRPQKEGYTFAGWYLDQALSEKVTEVKMTKSLTLYAKWVANNGQTAVLDCLNGEDHMAYLFGDGDGNVRPEESVTRAEVAAILYRVLKEDVKTAYQTGKAQFDDVPVDSWYNQEVITLANMGIILGRRENRFEPQEVISRAEFAAIVARLSKEQASVDSPFVDTVGHWAEDEIALAAEKGWIKGIDSEKFQPNAAITRAQLVTIINRMLNRGPSAGEPQPTNTVLFADNQNPALWYYGEICEASTAH